MEDWGEEHIPPLNLRERPKSKWDDEDVDENDLKESWEDEDEPAPARAPPSMKHTEKAPKKSSEKATGKKDKKIVIEKEETVDLLVEKLRQQRLVEEADYKTTKELFGNRDDVEKKLDNFIPTSENDFLEYAQLISHKFRPFEKSYHYKNLLKTLMRLSMSTLKGAEVKEIASSLNAIANEKLKAEKEAKTSKKKTGAKKKQLHLDQPDEDLALDPYSVLDDCDFM